MKIVKNQKLWLWFQYSKHTNWFKVRESQRVNTFDLCFGMFGDLKSYIVLFTLVFDEVSPNSIVLDEVTGKGGISGIVKWEQNIIIIIILISMHIKWFGWS